MKRIIIDVCGADNPKAIIKGAVNTVNCIKDIKLILCGDEQFIKDNLSQENFDASSIEILGATDFISNNENPTLAMREKPNSSLVLAMNYLKDNDDVIALISAGSTGAVLVCSIFILGNMKGVMRPCLATALTTVSNKRVYLLDCGANSDCLPEYLAQFAIMGSCYAKSVGKIENPKVALLSVGTEEKKGNALVKEAHKLIKELPINFVGNMEARDVLSEKFDVVVADGFSGNIILKSIEGTAMNILKMLGAQIKKNASKTSDLACVETAFSDVLNAIDFNSLGGAVVLGVNKLIVKAHGSANEKTVLNTVKQALELDEGKCVEETKKLINNF